MQVEQWYATYSGAQSFNNRRQIDIAPFMIGIRYGSALRKRARKGETCNPTLEKGQQHDIRYPISGVHSRRLALRCRYNSPLVPYVQRV